MSKSLEMVSRDELINGYQLIIVNQLISITFLSISLAELHVWSYFISASSTKQYSWGYFPWSRGMIICLCQDILTTTFSEERCLSPQHIFPLGTYKHRALVSSAGCLNKLSRSSSPVRTTESQGKFIPCCLLLEIAFEKTPKVATTYLFNY